VFDIDLAESDRAADIEGVGFEALSEAVEEMLVVRDSTAVFEATVAERRDVGVPAVRVGPVTDRSMEALARERDGPEPL
jgi:hypothetical protein